MELLVVIVIALVLALMNSVETQVTEDVIVRETLLNPEFFVCEDAFMEVASALGFGADSSSPYNTDSGMRTEPVHSIPADTAGAIHVTRSRHRD